MNEIFNRAKLQLMANAQIVSVRGNGAIEPSSLMISQITPMGRAPASLTRFIMGSVCPAQAARRRPVWRAMGKHARAEQDRSGTGSRLGHDLDRLRAIRRADAGGDSLGGVHADLEIGAEIIGALVHHLLDAQLLELL